MKRLLVLVTIHNLKLQQASLIMAAAASDGPVESRATSPDVSQHLGSGFLKPLGVLQLARSQGPCEQLPGVYGVCSAALAVARSSRLCVGVSSGPPCTHLLISQTEGKLVASHPPPFSRSGWSWLLLPRCVRRQFPQKRAVRHGVGGNVPGLVSSREPMCALRELI